MRWFVLLLLAIEGPLRAQEAVLADYAGRLANKLNHGTAITVVQEADVRAAAWPSGEIFITTAMIARTSNEAALAGVIAHEIAHQTAALSRIPLPEGGLCARFVRTSNDHGQYRERERLADEGAQKMLVHAGYDPRAMVEFFSKLRRDDPKLPGSFSAEDLLLEKLQLEADPPRAKDLVLSTSEFEDVHKRLAYKTN